MKSIRNLNPTQTNFFCIKTSSYQNIFVLFFQTKEDLLPGIVQNIASHTRTMLCAFMLCVVVFNPLGLAFNQLSPQSPLAADFSSSKESRMILNVDHNSDYGESQVLSA